MKAEIELWGVSSEGMEEFVSSHADADEAKKRGEEITRDMRYYNYRVYSHKLLHESDWA